VDRLVSCDKPTKSLSVVGPRAIAVGRHGTLAFCHLVENYGRGFRSRCSRIWVGTVCCHRGKPIVLSK